ncbi:MAG: hypothetical protein ACOC1F_01945, partial [Myxococcota bacterium]
IPETGVGFVGLRFKPYAFGRFRPFLGGFGNAGFAFSAEGEGTEHIAAVGPRLGVEYRAAGSPWLLAPELNVIRSVTAPARFYFDLDRTWLVWLGFSAYRLH